MTLIRTGDCWLYLAMLPNRFLRKVLSRFLRKVLSRFLRKVLSPEIASTTPLRKASFTRWAPHDSARFVLE